MTNEHEGSAEQEAWVSFAAGLRSRLSRQLKGIESMDPTDVRNFVEAVHTSFMISVNAATFDELVEQQKLKGAE